MRLRPKDELPPAAAKVESPYDPEARFRRRCDVGWVGYIVHPTETCEDDAVHLLTHVLTTAATVHEAGCTATIQRALIAKGLPPGEHLVDAAYVDAELLVRSREELGIALVGPPRLDPSCRRDPSQGVRAFGLRRSRYRGLAKTHLQHVATGVAINLGRLGDWFRSAPRAAARTSRFAA